MDAFRFILENPHPAAQHNKQRKRARLVTACDSCRVKKIKCQQSTPDARCEACKSAKTPCLFGDRDRYQAERGVTCTWSPTPLQDAPASSPEPYSRKRKITSPSIDQWCPPPSLTSSRPPSPTQYRYVHPESQAGPSSLVQEFDAFPLSSPSYDSLPLFDPARPRYPHPQRMRHLGALFFDNVGFHFPFLDRYDVLHRIEHRTCSAILSNCIAGLAARFSDPESPDFANGPTFYDMAKSLAAHVVSIPSVEALHALLCITWAEYSSGRDSSFYTYARMAISMCLDLGLGNEATIQVANSPEVRLRLRLTWWSVVCMADISTAWATGQPTVLDLDTFDTALPQATDDASIILRNIIEILVLRGRLSHFLDVHTDSKNDSSLQWNLSDIQAELKAISRRLPSSLVFKKENLAHMHQCRLGHIFVNMHILIHAVSALASHPSLLPSYGLQMHAEGPRTEAARSSAKSMVDILMVVEESTPQALSDPFLDLPLLVAARVFMAQNAAQPAATSPQSNMLAIRWSDTFLSKCKDLIVRIYSAHGGVASFDNILDRHGGTLGDDPHPVGTSAIDLFTAPQNVTWLLRPGLTDDTASDTSSSLRSSSRELSPRLAQAQSVPSSLGASPLVRGMDELLPATEISFRPSDFFEAGFHGEMFNMQQFLDESCGMPFALDNSQEQLLGAGAYLPKDTTSSTNLFTPPLSWLTRA